jgi:hypothetical protein
MKKRVIPSVPKKEREKLNEGVGTPDLDCGIYLPDKDHLLPTNNNTKMPEKPDLQKIHNAIYPTGSYKGRYSRIIPNSHFWTDLNQILQTIKYAIEREKHEGEKITNVLYVGEPITSEYIIIGLGNSLMRGYKLKQDKNIKTNPKNYIIFTSLEQMIEFVQNEDFTLEMFQDIIFQTINVGFNLTNGKKMEREHVYKRIDAERKYQDLRWSSDLRIGDVSDEEKPVSEWLNYIEYHLSKAKDCNYHLEKNNALAELRKVAALAVRAMEIHGCPERIMPEHIGNMTINSDGTTTTIHSHDAAK